MATSFRATYWYPMGAWPESSTLAELEQRTPRWTWWPPGTYLKLAPRQVLRENLGCGDLEWQRGKAWAFQQAMGAVWYYRVSNSAMNQMGRRTLGRIIAVDPSA